HTVRHMSVKPAENRCLIYCINQETEVVAGFGFYFSLLCKMLIRKNPVARDVSEIIRTMPGVNLTGNSTSGQRERASALR
ncbi:hypothetical protein O5833_26925, partial [Escherichia coli]|nr:hypothetical protein [Escherichia coli]